MKEIKLTQNKVALVDDEDFEYLNQWKWHAEKGKCTFYAKRTVPIGKGKYTTLRMHEIIAGKGIKHISTADHIDGDGLNNQKNNLRIVTHRQNMQNKHLAKTSRFPGVCFDKNRNKWTSQINKGNNHQNLGRFSTEDEAFEVYRKAVENLGEEMVEQCQNY